MFPDDDVGVVARLTVTFAGDLPPTAIESISLVVGCTLLTFACRDCVVAVSVDTRGSSAPADADGWTVMRFPFPMLALRVTVGLDDSGGTGGPACGTGFLSMKLLNNPGPIDFLGAFVGFAGAGCPRVDELCGTVDCLLVRKDTVA